MIDFIAFIKTIKGRVAALVIIFIFLLTLFSSTTYLVSKKLNKLLATEEVWGRLQLNTAFSKWSFTIRQAVLAENIAKNNIPDKEQREKIRAERLNSTKTFYIDLDSLGVKLENELAAESKAILDFENQAEKIYARMEAIQQSDPNASFAKDSIIKNIMNNELPAIVYNFYQKTKAVAQFIIDSRNATRKEINDTIKFLIALILIVSFISAVSIILIWQYINKSLIKSIKKPKELLEEMSLGKLPEAAEVTEDELGTIIESSNKLAINLKEASLFAREIGKGNFEYQYEPLSEEDLLGNALKDMRSNLKEYAEKEKQQNWTNVGLARFSDILRNSDRDLSEVCNELLSTLIKYIRANQGGLFLVKDDATDMELVACYAYERRKFIEKTVQPGEGLVGQCYLEADKILLTEIPSGYIKITSGVGEATPNCLLLMPLKNEDKVEGVLEIASFHRFQPFEIEFVEKLCQSIASVVSGIKRNNLTKKLLKETEIKTNEMRSQEEELRQNLEELHATQEEMRRREASFIEEISQLKQRITELEAMQVL